MEKQTRSTGEILHRIATHTKDKSIVTSSARLHERRSGKRLGNAEAKLGAYVARIEALLEADRTRSRVEERIAQNFAIHSQDVPESYWRNQERFARAHGDELHLNDYHKKFAIDTIRDTQITGAKRWIDQLNNSETMYPTWFKLYALDGLSRMGRFNPKEKRYRTRSNSTVAPYPYLDSDALDKTFAATQTVYEQNDNLEDEQLDTLVRGGSFNKIYSHFTMQNSVNLEVPDDPRQIQGQWCEYNPFMVNELMDASQGTYWCTAGTEMASYYLQDQSHRFYMFHLQDPQTGRVSPTGSVAIHTECGLVDEVVGQADEAQTIHLALLPVVKDKLFELPGGAYYYYAMQDNTMLNDMDSAFRAGRDFTPDELVFLYEVERKILHKTDQGDDVRVRDFKQQRVAHQHQLEAVYGNDAYWMVMDSQEVADILPQLINGGVDPGRLIKKLVPSDIIYNYDTLVELGAAIDVDELVASLNRREFNDNLLWIVEHASTEALLQHRAATQVVDEVISFVDKQ